MERDAVRIRRIEPAELPAADELVRAAFRSGASFAPELRRYHAIEPEGMFVAATDEGLLGLAGAFDFGAFGYIGPMAVHPERQQRGIGRRLLETALAWMEARGTRLAFLDATDAGVPLYRACGFRHAGEGRLYARNAAAAVSAREERATCVGVRIIEAGDLDAIAAFDAPIFGAPRPRALRVVFDEFPRRGFVARDAHGGVTGYVYAGVRRVGPWVARERAQAEALLDAALALPFPAAPEVAVPAGNTCAPELLEARGFRLKFTVRHMQRGATERRGDRGRLLAQLSFATG